MSTTNLPELPAGVYKHYKGHYYQVFGYGSDANIEGRIVVQYVGLELDGASTGPRLTSRDAVSDDPKVDAWWDFVHTSDRTKCTHHQGDSHCSAGRVTTPRFEYVGPGWEGRRAAS